MSIGKDTFTFNESGSEAPEAEGLIKSSTSELPTLGLPTLSNVSGLFEFNSSVAEGETNTPSLVVGFKNIKNTLVSLVSL